MDDDYVARSWRREIVGGLNYALRMLEGVGAVNSSVVARPLTVETYEAFGRLSIEELEALVDYAPEPLDPSPIELIWYEARLVVVAAWYLAQAVEVADTDRAIYYSGQFHSAMDDLTLSRRFPGRTGVNRWQDIVDHAEAGKRVTDGGRGGGQRRAVELQEKGDASRAWVLKNYYDQRQRGRRHHEIAGVLAKMRDCPVGIDRVRQILKEAGAKKNRNQAP